MSNFAINPISLKKHYKVRALKMSFDAKVPLMSFIIIIIVNDLVTTERLS